MKKIIALNMCLLSGFIMSESFFDSSLPYICTVSASEIQADGITYEHRENNENELIITAYSGKSDKLIIPESVDGYKVTAIDDEVFMDNQNIKDVVLPDTIYYFGSDVFRNSSLTSINIPKSLRVIPSYSFNNCEMLTDVVFHDNIICFANTAFKKTEVSVPEKYHKYVTEQYLQTSDISIIRNIINEWKYNLVSINGETYINLDVYYGAETDVVIPDKIDNIDVTACSTYTFALNKNIKRVVFPPSIKTMETVFSDSQLEEIILPTTDVIPDKAFSNCKNLKKIEFQNGSESFIIGRSAFEGCSQIDFIPLPDNCKSLKIKDNAFKDTALTSIDFQIITEIGNNAFKSCQQLKNVSLNNSNVMDRAFADCNNLTEVTLSGKVYLGDLCFFDCVSLENINVADCTLTSKNAFRCCPSLYKINTEQAFDKKTQDFVSSQKDFIFKHFSGADEVGFINDYVMAETKRVVEECTDEDMSDIEKIKALHDWVCNNTKYTEGDIGEREYHNDASVFMNEYTVCEGYARACNLLFNASGFETYYVEGIFHAWNIVKIGNMYFHIDSTWDDKEAIVYDWFMKSDNEIRGKDSYHERWSLTVPSVLHSFQKSELPECNYSMGDVNMDKEINIADLVVLQKYLLGNDDFSEDNSILADIDFDGEISSIDMTLMRKYIIYNQKH